jgi:PAS domain S-box-containing protein
VGTATPVRVLVVDDDARNGAAMRGTLEGLDAEVVVVTSGADALRALLGDRFAVVLLDVQMPEMDGFETAELIRRRDRTRDVPIVFVTAIHQADEHVRRGYDLGAVDYLFKPFEPAILRQKVRVFVELARARIDAEEHAELLAISEARYRELSERLEQSEELLRRTLDAAPVAVFLLDGDAVVQSSNPAASRMFGWSADELVGQPLPIVHPAQRSDFEALIRRALAGDPIDAVDLDAYDRTGREIAALVYAAAVRDARRAPSTVVAIVADITERLQADLALRRANIDAETWNRELVAFSSAVAHDLRAPLRSIHGFVGILLEDHGAQLDEAVRPLLARIVGAVDRMSRLIDELLALSHCSQAPLVRQAVDLSALARAVLDRLAEEAPERDVRVVVADGLAVEGDLRLLELLMENLLSNAWKFTSHHTRATIEVGRDQRTGELFVRDDGAGFDPRFAGSLFLPFRRLHGSEFEGNGIGLATVDRIVRRHGGTVRAEGRVEGGATFYFTLP